MDMVRFALAGMSWGESQFLFQGTLCFYTHNWSSKSGTGEEERVAHPTGSKEGQGGGDRRGRDKGDSSVPAPGFSHLNIHYWVRRDSLLPGLCKRTPGSIPFPFPFLDILYFLCGIIAPIRMNHEQDWVSRLPAMWTPILPASPPKLTLGGRRLGNSRRWKENAPSSWPFGTPCDKCSCSHCLSHTHASK